LGSFQLRRPVGTGVGCAGPGSVYTIHCLSSWGLRVGRHTHTSYTITVKRHQHV